MASQHTIKMRRNYLFASLILITGFGGLLGYDLYVKPYVLSQTVVKIKTANGSMLPKNHELSSGDMYLDSVQTKDVPDGAITDIAQVVDKITNVNLMNGSILTESLVDVGGLEPQQDEGIFPIPKDSIYAINGSLRSRDKVDLYLIDAKSGKSQIPTSIAGVYDTSDSAATDAEPALSEQGEMLFLSGVTVNYVRSEDNNDVLDSENGNINNRYTSTGKVAAPELKLKKSDGEQLGFYLSQGKKLWIVRVE